ncbi:MAG: DNA polymerase III subunit gamma/tau [Oscillospiraceae bacterium]|nr:DNA polymerase III subunit gamma/tau [Oscillospiraceae bacterium]
MYQALYRKWRPKTFDEVVGQEHVTATLKNQVRTGRLSHAYLFIGTRGTGKTSCAKILAKAVNCLNPRDGNPCNACRFCRGVDDGSLMDVVEMDAASNNGVDNVRQLRDEAVFSPAEAKKRVYIIDEVHMLSTSAFNALLKILEEPPAHLMFILATTELNKVPATILSRCQRHSFKRLDAASVIGRLQYVAEQEKIDLSPDAAALIAGLSEGGMRDALSMLDQCAGQETIDVDAVYAAMGLAGNREIAALLGHIAAHDTSAAVELFERLWQDGKGPSTVLGELSGLLRDLLMRAVAPRGGRALLSGGYDEALLRSFDGKLSPAALTAAIDRIQTALNDMRSGQARTICELCLISLSEPGLNDTLPMLRQRVEELERRLSSGLPAAPAVQAPPPVKTPPAAPAPPPAQEDAPPPPWEEEPPPWLDEEAPPLPLEEAPVQPPVRDAPPTAAAPAESVSIPAEDGELWERARDRAAADLPFGLRAILTDPAETAGRIVGDELTVTVQTDFTKNMLDRPDVIAKLAAAASELAGRGIRVRFALASEAREGAAPDPAAKLEELAKYPIVKFK